MIVSTQLTYTMMLMGTTLVALGLIGIGWRYRAVPVGRTFMAFSVGIAAWAFMDGLTIASNDPGDMLTFSKLSYIGIVLIPPLWYLFTSLYIGEASVRRRWFLALLFVIPVFTLGMVWSNDLHNLHWTQIDFVTVNGFLAPDYTYGVTFWLNLAYSYVLILIATYKLFWIGANAVRLKRREATLLMSAGMMPWLGNVLYVTGTNPFEGLDLTSIMFLISATFVGYAMVRYRGLGNVPVTRDFVIESLGEGLIVVDMYNRVIDINAAARHILGLPETEKIVNRPVGDLLQKHPDVLSSVADLARQGGRGQATEASLFDTTVCFVRLHLTNITSRSGQTAGYLLTVQDITERKRAEVSAARNLAQIAALRQVDARISGSLSLQKVLSQALSDAMHMSAADAGFISFVETEADALTQRIAYAAGNYDESMIGKEFPATVGVVGRVMQSHDAEIVRDVSNDPNYHSDLPGTVALMAFPLIVRERLIGVLNLETCNPDAFGDDAFAFVLQLAGRIAVALENAQLYDTSQRQLEEITGLYEQVSQLEQLKTDLIRIASHDLKNPLSALDGYVTLLQMDKDQLSDEHRGFVKEMRTITDRMYAIIQDVLATERMTVDVATERVDLLPLVTDVVGTMRAQAIQKRQTFTLHTHGDEIAVEGDAAQLREAVANLVGNAIKYTPERGSITVSLARVKDDIVFEVTDTGYGVPEDQQADLFKPFVRAKSEETNGIEGTGLGLHLVKNIVERHNGSMRFQSVYKKGSTFGFALPLFRSSEAVPQVEANPM